MNTNFLIIGSGISGLNFALHAAQKGKVLIVTKKKIVDSSTNFAQGGIAAILDKTDNIKAHVRDTLEAGAFHNNKKAVEFMVKNSTAAIHRLIELGVKFASEKGELKLTREGGHNKRRIAYVGDYTGKEIERILVKRVKEHPNITILENTFALKLITNVNISSSSKHHKFFGSSAYSCFGAQIIHKRKIKNILANQTILATGGIGQLYSYTTNPDISTGDGIALGIEAGCKTRDLEFIQFHPTALAEDTYPRFLISETVRGEGARLINSRGEYFMEKLHPLKDLAPRDIVAREIYAQLKGGPVYLDCRGIAKKIAARSGKSEQAEVRPRTKTRVKTLSSKFDKSTSKIQTAGILQQRFPQIYKELLKHGYHMEKDLIPVTPAAHYICGGLVTDLHGRVELDSDHSNLSSSKKLKFYGNLKKHSMTSKQLYLNNLFAFGEVACTGVHGANRLASNSLLEALVFSNQIVKKLTGAGQLTSKYSKSFTGDTFKLMSKNSPKSKTALALKQQIKHLMWQYAGIIRNHKEIKEKAIPEMTKIIKKLEKLTNINTFPGTEILSRKTNSIPTNQTLAETQNIAKIGLLILKAAYKRTHSLGCHFVTHQA